MRIIVPIKQVPETNAVRMDEVTGTMIREGVEAIVNPLDLYTIETALRIREQHGGEVVVLSMGPPSAAGALKEAVAMGCDRGVLISNRAFAGSDTWATSYALSQGIRKIGGFDLILCGERATDGDTGQVGPGIAAFLDLPVATYVGKVESLKEKDESQRPKVKGEAGASRLKGVARVQRLVETGHEVLEIDLPAVLTVVKEIGEPRLPTLQGKRRARAADIPVWGPDEVGADASRVGLTGSPTRVVKIFRPRVARECEKIVAADEASVERAADRMIEFLKEKEIL